MSIRRHGSGWEVRVQHAGDRSSKTLGTYRDAQEYERRFKQRIADHRVGRAPSYALEEALGRWLAGEARALRSYRNLRNKVRTIYPHAKGKRLDQIVDVAEAVKSAGVSKGLKPATINRRLAILRRVARLAHRRWEPAWLDRDLGAKISLLPGEEPRYVRATPEQAAKLIRSAAGRTRKAIIWGAMTGLRPSELLRVEPHHFKNGSLMVESYTKNKKPRLVPLQGRLRAQDFPYGLTPHDVQKSFREARSNAGMPWLQFRDLRRTFGSWIVQRTRSLKAAQELLGHTTIAITSKHYAHLVEGDLRKAIGTLPDLVGQARGRQKKKKVA